MCTPRSYPAVPVVVCHWLPTGWFTRRGPCQQLADFPQSQLLRDVEGTEVMLRTARRWSDSQDWTSAADGDTTAVRTARRAVSACHGLRRAASVQTHPVVDVRPESHEFGDRGEITVHYGGDERSTAILQRYVNVIRGNNASSPRAEFHSIATRRLPCNPCMPALATHDGFCIHVCTKSHELRDRGDLAECSCPHERGTAVLFGRRRYVSTRQCSKRPPLPCPAR
jgi:hypothetical protein